MKYKLKLIFFIAFFITESSAQLFDYNASNRRVLADGTGFGDTSITINNKFGYWNLEEGVGVPSSGTFSGALQISDLGSHAICAKSYAWNKIVGSHPSGGDAQTSINTSFALETDVRIKVDFFGAIHADTYQGYLFIEPQFFLRSGFTGSGGTLLNIVGSGVQYIDLPSGDYQMTTAVGVSYNCRNDPNCIAFISGQSNLSITSLDLLSNPGESSISPFVPDNYTETDSPDASSITPEGAFIIRGENSSYTYIDETDGWFDIGDKNQTFIEMQNENILTELQLPDNRQGEFQFNVGGVLLGEYFANDVIVFADHAETLGSMLLTGVNVQQGVTNLEMIYHSSNGDNLNACGGANNTAVKLKFDEALVSFNVIMPFTPIPDGIFDNGFEE